MIRIITDGALPSPAKCASCGSSETTNRIYVDFKFYERKFGRVLICSLCMNEASQSPQLDFVPRSVHMKLIQRFSDQSAALNVFTEAVEVFKNGFAGLVTNFNGDLSGAVYNPATLSKPNFDTSEIPIAQSQDSATSSNENEFADNTVVKRVSIK